MKQVPLFICMILSQFVSDGQVILKNDLTPQGTVSVQPMKNDFHLRAGESGDIQIYISNKMGTKMQFNVYLGDWRRDTAGAHVYSAPGSEDRSCAAWLTFDKTFIEVDSGSIGIIHVKMQVPETPEAATEMKWAMLFVETIRESKAPVVTKEMRTEIIPSTRFGIHIYQTPPAVNQKELKLTSFINVTGKENVFRIVCENTGKVQASEIAQLYVQDIEASVSRPVKELKDFIKVDMKPGEKVMVELEISEEDLSFWDETNSQWKAESGKFNVLIGSSSRDITLKGSFELTD